MDVYGKKYINQIKWKFTTDVRGYDWSIESPRALYESWSTYFSGAWEQLCNVSKKIRP